MGCPVNTFRDFVNEVRDNDKKNLTIVVFASAQVRSAATKFVIENFNDLDEISGDVNFYLPGYGISRYKRNFTSAFMAESLIDMYRCKFNNISNGFFNENALLSKSIFALRSNRLNKDILFNGMEFSDFIRNFSQRIEWFNYMGGCTLLILPKNDYGMPDFDRAKAYPLDILVDEFSNCDKVRYFLYDIFHLINSWVNDNYILSEIDRKYKTLTNEDNRTIFKI